MSSFLLLVPFCLPCVCPQITHTRVADTTQSQVDLEVFPVLVRRGDLAGAWAALLPLEDWRGPLRVQFIGEAGVDAGGLTTSFFHDTVELALDPASGLFEQADERATLRLPKAGADRESLRLLGALLRKVLLDGRVAEAARRLPLCLFDALLRTIRCSLSLLIS